MPDQRLKLDRRQALIAGTALLASCAAPGSTAKRIAGSTSQLDRVFRANASVLPERAGAGANHYPMAAEALEAMGFPQLIPTSWATGASGYAGETKRVSALEAWPSSGTKSSLGHYERYGDWLDLFRDELDRSPWQQVVNAWSVRLAPGLVGGLFHGLLRTAHATRALRFRVTPDRIDELAIGLAYWASRYLELPNSGAPVASGRVIDRLADLDYLWQDDDTDLDFDHVSSRLISQPIAPQVSAGRPTAAELRHALNDLVEASAVGYLEMLVQERNRLWLLHAVTGPAAIDLMLPSINEDAAAELLAYARQATEAVWIAFGEPFEARAHLREELPPWSSLVQQAAESQSIHGIKLLDALHRFGSESSDPIWKSVAVQWFEWT